MGVSAGASDHGFVFCDQQNVVQINRLCAGQTAGFVLATGVGIQPYLQRPLALRQFCRRRSLIPVQRATIVVTPRAELLNMMRGQSWS
jgi:hypothetical protein